MKVKINKNRRIIWTNNDYSEWKEAMMEFDGYSEEECTYELYSENCDENYYAERSNLDIEVDGYIICFASLGLWNGRRTGAGIVGTNVKDILHSACDYLTWYCDRYNVKCKAVHHDGTNYYLYRVAKDYHTAQRIVNKIVSGNMTEEQFRKATTSLRKYVAKVYGW